MLSEIYNNIISIAQKDTTPFRFFVISQLKKCLGYT
jgi:hypothetical protein